MRKPKIALVHDYLTQYGGAETTLESIIDIFPDAPIFTGLYDPIGVSNKINSAKVIQGLPNPLFRKFSKYATFLMPMVFENFDLRNYDIVISDGTAWSKGVLTKSNQLHVSYIHTPPRFLYGYSTETSKRDKWPFKPMVKVIDHFLRIWDFNAAQRPNYLIANSKEVQSRIKKFYGRDSSVIYPPVETEAKEVLDKEFVSIELRKLIPYKPGTYYLSLGRLAKYKNIDLIVKTFNKMGKHLVVAGTGVEEEHLRKIGGDYVFFTGRIKDNLKFGLIEDSKALISATKDEDFGIIYCEFLSRGKPVLAHRSGGPLEIIQEGKTGLFFDELTPENLSSKVIELDELINEGKFDPEYAKESVKKFSSNRFKEELRDFIDNKWEELSNAGAP